MVSGALFGFMGNMYKIKLLSSQNLTAKEISSKTGVHEFVVSKYSGKVRNLSDERLGKMIDACIEADLAIKTTSAEDDIILYELTQKLLNLV